MTMPGPDHIVACPKCKGLARHRTYCSFYILEGGRWTDGKRDTIGEPDLPSVVKCRHCAACYWLAKAKQIGGESWGSPGEGEDRALANAEYVVAPTEQEYYPAIDAGLAKSPRQERELRIMAWWLRNDVFRKKPPAMGAHLPKAREPWRKNLEALTALLSEKNNQGRMFKAEVLRELGEFEAATKLLSEVKAPGLAGAVRRLKALCDRRDVWVRRLESGEPGQQPGD